MQAGRVSKIVPSNARARDSVSTVTWVRRDRRSGIFEEQFTRYPIFHLNCDMPDIDPHMLSLAVLLAA